MSTSGFSPSHPEVNVHDDGSDIDCTSTTSFSRLNLKNNKKPSIERESNLSSESILPPCRICAEKASGLHYGVNTCQACKVSPKLKKKFVAYNNPIAVFTIVHKYFIISIFFEGHV